jgi:ribonuclease J
VPKTVSIKVLGGANEVGGNLVLLEDFAFDVKLFLDFGIKIGHFYDYYELGEHPTSIEELIQLKLIPDENNISISNLYTKQFNHRRKSNKGLLNDENRDDDRISNLDGIFISHPHKDHYFGLSFVNRTIPIYSGEVTRKIILAFYKSAKFTLDNNYGDLNWHTFRTGDILSIKGLKIVPIHVDHSIPAAYGFIVYTSAGPVVYTGDFRMHGILSTMTEDFIREIQTNNSYFSIQNLTQEQKNLVSDGVKVLICEGTHVQKGVVESEQMVESSLNNIFEKNPFDFILVKYDRVDWDRFRTFSHIAKKYGWKYIISEKDAYFYYLLNKGAIHETMKDPNIVKDDHIFIFKRGVARFSWQEKIRQIMYKSQKGDRFLEYPNLKRLEGKYFVFLTSLHDDIIKNIDLNLKGLFISSSLDPYSEEFYDNTKTIGQALKNYGIPCYRAHASGHATPHDLINFIHEVNPHYLIPIHTEHTHFFEKLFQDTNIDVITCKAYESLNF